MAPGMMGSGAAPNSPFGALAQGPEGVDAGANPAQDQLAQLAGQIRDIGMQVDQLATSNPALQAEAAQVKAVLRQMVLKAAQTAPMQTMSSEAVPTAGM